MQLTEEDGVKIKIELAKQLSKHFHKGQKYGEYDYFEYHILGVMNNVHNITKVEHISEELYIVALLHDILEDTDCSMETLENIFGDYIFEQVYYLTKGKHISQDAYIDRIVRNKTARIVKYADSLFNYTESIKVGDTKRAYIYQQNLNHLYSKELLK